MTEAKLKALDGLCNPVTIGTDPAPAHPAVGHESVKTAPVKGSPRFATQGQAVVDRFGARDLVLKKPVRVLVPGGMADGTEPAAVSP